MPGDCYSESPWGTSCAARGGGSGVPWNILCPVRNLILSAPGELFKNLGYAYGRHSIYSLYEEDKYHSKRSFALGESCSSSWITGSTWTTCPASAVSQCHVPPPRQASLPPHQLMNHSTLRLNLELWTLVSLSTLSLTRQS